MPHPRGTTGRLPCFDPRACARHAFGTRLLAPDVCPAARRSHSTAASRASPDTFIVGYTPSLPSYASVSFSLGSTYAWASNTSDPRARQNPASGTAGRTAATQYSNGLQFPLDISVNLTDSQLHTGLTVMSLAGDLHVIDQAIEINFGPGGVGATPNSSAGDG